MVRPKIASLYKRRGKSILPTSCIAHHYKLASSYPAKNVHREFRIEEHWFDLIAHEHAAHRREAVEDGIEFQLLLCLYVMQNTQTFINEQLSNWCIELKLNLIYD